MFDSPFLFFSQHFHILVLRPWCTVCAWLSRRHSSLHSHTYKHVLSYIVPLHYLYSQPMNTNKKMLLLFSSNRRHVIFKGDYYSRINDTIHPILTHINVIHLNHCISHHCSIYLSMHVLNDISSHSCTYINRIHLFVYSSAVCKQKNHVFERIPW